LEIGTGDGVRVRSLLKSGLLRPYDHIIGSDLSESRVEHMRDLNIEAVVADAQALPFGDSSVDFVLSDQVIEHVPDDRKMAQEIARVLKPGGTGFIGSVLKLRGGWYFYRNHGQWVLDPTHVREYRSPEEYRRLFTDVGLAVVKMTQDPLKFSVSDLVVRGLVMTKLLSRERAARVYETSLSRIRGLQIPLRYRILGAFICKEA